MDAFHSDDTSIQNSKSEEKQFNGLTLDELLCERNSRDIIDISRIDESVEKYTMLKEIITDANTVKIYGDDQTEEAYFDHLFRRALEMDLHNEGGSYGYEDLVGHLAAANSELGQDALEEARLSYELNFVGRDMYEAE